MCKIYLLIIFAFLNFSVKSITLDSLKLKLDRLPLSEQFTLIDNLSFDDVTSNCQKVTPILLKYENIALESKRFNSLAKIYVNLSLTYYYLGKYDENLKYGLKALALYDSLGNMRELGTMYGELGYQMKRRDLSKANDLMRKGIGVLEILGAPEPLAKIYDNYGVLKEMNNQLDSANFFYRKALSIKYSMRDSLGIPYSLNNICMLYMLKNSIDSAVWYLNESTKIRQKRGDAIGLAENYGYFGQIYSSVGQFDSGISYLQQSLAIARKYHYSSLVRSIYSDLADVNEKKKDYKEALKFQKLYREWNDSLTNQEANKTIADLQVQYETSEKEKALIQSATQLKQQKVIKISILITSIILLVSVVIYYRNRIVLFSRNEKIKVQNALIEGEQAERNRLALELHDSVANDLNGVILLLRNAESASETNSNNGISRSIEKLSETHQQVRKMSHTLMPRSLKEKGLKYAIDDLVKDFQTDNLSIEIQLLGLEERLHPFLEFNVFCIVQESLNNIAKHAQATRVFIECNRVEDRLFVNIEDNGIGFDTNNAAQKRGIGLDNISNRAKMMQGELALNSAIGNGTSIELQIPLI